MKYSLKSLFFGVTCIAVCCAALTIGTRPVAAASMALTFVLLLSAIVFCFVSQGSKRAFWFGFSVFGWGFLMVHFLPSLETKILPTRLSPTSLVDDLLDKMHPLLVHNVPADWDPSVDPQGYNSSPTGTLFGDGKGGYVYKLPVLVFFRVIGQMLFTILMALLGGILGRFLYQRRQAATAVP
jgi:hypothetical protein